MAIPETRRTPWHLWVMGIASLLWNAIGAYDYTMSMTVDRAYLQQAGMGPAELAWLAAMPPWALAGWALAVWGALLGSIMLLARSRWAVSAYIVSIIGIVPTMAYQYGSDVPPTFVSAGAIIFSAAIVVLTLAQLWYAVRMRAAGVLR